MPIAFTGQIVTRGSQLSGKFVTSGSTAVQRIIKFSPFDPGPTFTKLGGGLQQARLHNPAKFQPDRINGLRNVRYQSSSLCPWGLTSGPKFTKVRQMGR